MLVEEGGFSLRGSREQLINARVTVHAFAEALHRGRQRRRTRPRNGQSSPGDQAFAELETRRRGLAVAIVVIVGIPGRAVAEIRSLPSPD